MQVLITGAAGFVASFLCEELLDRGHEVRAMIHYDDSRIAHIADRMEVIRGDVRFPDECMEAVDGVDAVSHLAALIHVDRSRRYPAMFWETNVGGTLNMLEAVRKHWVRMVYQSTCEVLGEVTDGKATEKHTFKMPQSPYAASKFSAETYCSSYQTTYDMDIRIARCFNIAGPRQKHGDKGAVIPIFIKRVLAGKPPLIYGSGEQTRDYTDVRDIVRGLRRVLEAERWGGELVHFCSGMERSIKSIAEAVIEACDSDLESVYIAGRPGELMRSVGDYGKAEKLLGWKPVIPFEQTLKDMVAYERSR